MPTLSYRRSRGDMIETYKILGGKYDEDCTEGLFTLQVNETRGHSKKLYKTRARLNIRKYTFPNRVVNNWNSLPERVVNSETTIRFEKGLDSYWKNQDQKFNYKTQIATTTTQDHEIEITNELEPQA